MGQAWKRGALYALFAAALLAGCFLVFLPVWERRREEERTAALLMQAQEAGQAVPGKPRGAGEPMEELAEEGLAGKQAEKAAQERPNIQEAEPEEAGEPGEGADPDGMAGIGILTIPKIDAHLPVTAGVSEDQLKVSEGWVRQSSPIGNMGNAVVAGHRSYTYGRHFNRLGELEAGDEIFFTSIDGGEMRFVVSEVVVTGPEDPAVFAQPPEGVARLTLYTCTPVRIASHRLIVRAERVE